MSNMEKTSASQLGRIVSGGSGLVLKEALEKARILFYKVKLFKKFISSFIFLFNLKITKGQQAAICANINGSYDLRIIDDTDNNLLRSVIITEVKMRPQQSLEQQSIIPSSPSKLLNEHEIGDDFRRSIDEALKGLKTVYQKSSDNSSEHTQKIPTDEISSSNVIKSTFEDNTVNVVHQKKMMTNMNDEEQLSTSQTDIQPKLVCPVDDMNDIMLDIMETTTESETGNPISIIDHDRIENKTNVERIMKEIKQHEENYDVKESIPQILPSSNALNSVSSFTQEQSNENCPESNMIKLNKDRSDSIKHISFDESAHITSTNLSSFDQIKESSTTNEVLSSEISTSDSSLNKDGDNKIYSEFSLPSSINLNDINTTVKKPSHNVTYTEITRSGSRDDEQSHRLITESSNEHPSTNDDQATTLKVVTRSEFSTNPLLDEKTMEQSIQVLTVKVQNETTTTTNLLVESENDLSCEKSFTKNDANTTDETN